MIYKYVKNLLKRAVSQKCAASGMTRNEDSILHFL